MVHLEVDAETVERLLKRGGWSCDRITKDVLRTHFRGQSARFPMYVRVDPSGYLTFAVVPLIKSPEERQRAESLYHRLLQLNQDLMMAKFSIDDDLDVVLSVEYPTAELDQSEFDDALDVLTYYADHYYRHLQELIG
jgi:hypothetical protein